MPGIHTVNLGGKVLILARTVIILAGLWLIAVSLFMIYKPDKALIALSKFASTNLINYTEISLRMLVGISFIVAAIEWHMSFIFNMAGWFLTVSAAVLFVVPRKWHQNYALYWAGKLTPFYVRAFAPLSLAVGIWALKTML